MDHPRPGIGHNGAPRSDPDHAWRTHCWRRSRAELIGQRLPLEVLKRRVARARELGLAYPAYASILLGSGRDIIGFLFTCDALGLRLRRRLEMPRAVQAQLAGLVRCDRLVIAPEAEDPQAFRAELQEVSALPFAGAGRPPRPSAGWSESAAAIREILAQPGLPSQSVVMIGTDPREAAWADAANLARFLPASAWSGGAGQGLSPG